MRSPFYEALITKQGLDFEYVEKLSLADIDGPRSLRNQARLDQPVDDELVRQYLDAYKAGDQFPPLVVWRPGRGRYILADGNHRLQALLAWARKTTDAYVLGTADEMVADRITWGWNNKLNGKRNTPEDSLRHAVSWVRKYGRTVKEAAKEFGVADWKIARETRAEGVREILNRHNLGRAANLGADVLDELSPLVNVGEDLVVKAGKLVLDTGLPARGIQGIVKEVSAAKTTEAKLEVLTEAAGSDLVVRTKAETKGGTVKVRTSPRTLFKSRLLQLRGMLEDYGKAVRPPNGKEGNEVRDAAQDVADRLTEVFGLGVRKEAQ